MIPILAAALSALAPTLAQQGLDLLSGVFSGAVTKGTEKVAELIQEKTGIEVRDIAENRLSEEQWAKLRDFEANDKAAILAAYVQLDTNDVERTRIASGDRENARALQIVAMQSSDTVERKFLYVLTMVLVVGTMFFLCYAAFWYDPATGIGSKGLVDSLSQTLLTLVLGGIMYFFYGTSASSARKDRKDIGLDK